MRYERLEIALKTRQSNQNPRIPAPNRERIHRQRRRSAVQFAEWCAKRIHEPSIRNGRRGASPARAAIESVPRWPSFMRNSPARLLPPPGRGNFDSGASHSPSIERERRRWLKSCANFCSPQDVGPKAIVGPTSSMRGAAVRPTKMGCTQAQFGLNPIPDRVYDPVLDRRRT